MRGPSTLAACALALGAAACTGVTRYAPTHVAPGEIVFHIDADGLALRADGRAVAVAHRYRGLTEFVGCVPEARHEATSAAESGVAGLNITYGAGILAVGGLAGLGGLALIDTDRTAAIGIVSAGLGAEVIALVLAGLGRQSKLEATGHAVDAANYYNDAVGSQGGVCPAEP